MSTLALKSKSARQIDLQIRQARAVLRELRETLEDLEDRRALAKAKKRNAGKPGTPWSEVAKELGISRRPCALPHGKMLPGEASG